MALQTAQAAAMAAWLSVALGASRPQQVTRPALQLGLYAGDLASQQVVAQHSGDGYSQASCGHHQCLAHGADSCARVICAASAMRIKAR